MAQTPVSFDEKEKIWSGPHRKTMSKDETSLGEIIFQNMRASPNNICQICDVDGVSVTFDQALTWAIRMAQFFKKKGLGHNDVIGILAENSTLLMPLGVACLMNGTPFHTVNPMWNEALICHILSLTKPLLIFCDGNAYEKIYKATIEWQPEIYILRDHVEGVPSIKTLLDPTTSEGSYQPEPLREGGDQTVAMLCSSGTTALPKAVCISNSRLMPLQGVSSGSVIFTWGTLSWISGLWGLVNSTALNCTRIISRKPFSAEYLVHLVENYKINVIGLPPSHVYDLVNCPMATSRSLGSIRLLICGGGVASTAILQRCQKLCENGTVSNTYAMSETGTICRAGGLTHGGTVGRPVPGYRIRIVDEQGVSQGHNQIGEIYVHSGLGWKGYYGNSEESRRMQDPDGWFHTGDLGYFDEQNFLFVVDRKKEILKYQQRPYWPAEIEKVILELPQVENVCVVGIFDEEVGDKAGALVVRSNETNISAKEIVNHVAKRLPELRRQLHAGVKFTNKLPLNANGKIMRKEARDLFNALGDLSNDKF